MDTATGIRARHSYVRRSGGSRASAFLLLDQLHGLRRSSFPDLAVTAYLPLALDTRWGQPADALRDLAAERWDGLEAAQRAALERELPGLRRALERDWRQGAGVAAFAHRPLRLAIRLRGLVVPRLVVAERLELRPLDEELAAHPPSLVVVADKEQTRIYASVLDRVTPVDALRGLPVHRHRQGGSSAEQWQRRSDEHAAHNLALAARRIAEVARAHPGFESIRVAAPDEALALLAEHLPEELRARIRPEPHLGRFASDGEVIEHLLAG